MQQLPALHVHYKAFSPPQATFLAAQKTLQKAATKYYMESQARLLALLTIYFLTYL